MQNGVGNETAAPMYKENPNQLFPQVRIVNDSMPICSNLSESLGNDPNVVYSFGIVRPNFKASVQGNTPSISSSFLNNRCNGNAHNTSNKGNASNSNGTTPLTQP